MAATVWTDAIDFPKIGGREKALYSPQAFGLEDRFYIVWVNVTGKLVWSYEKDGGAWSDTQLVQHDADADIVTSSPCVTVLDGKAHLVYGTLLGPTATNGIAQLVHLQLDPESRTWGRRCGVLARTLATQPQALAPFREVLYCVYRDATTQSMRLAQWTELDGWTRNTNMANVLATAAEPALFELNDTLHLLLADDGPGDSLIQHYAFNSASQSWDNLDPLGKRSDFVGWKSVVGVTAESVNDMVFAAFCNNSEMVTVQYDGSNWSMAQRKSTSTKTPSIAVVGNQIICVRASVVDGWISWLDRRVLDMPPLNAWMSQLSPQLKVSALTIPGAHDAAAISIVPFTTTQEVNISALLNAGVRYFDIRAAFPFWSLADDLVLVHSRVTIYEDSAMTRMKLSSVFQQFYDFLKVEKTEGLLVQIKLDAEWGEGTATRFAQRVTAMIAQSANFWLTSSSVPTVSQLRGKIQLVRRFQIPAQAGIAGDLGIDVSQNWLVNERDFSIPIGSQPSYSVRIQDYYTPAVNPAVGSLADVKFKAINDQMTIASADTSDNLYLNFTSATNWKQGWTSWSFAVGEFAATQLGTGVNYKLRTKFNKLSSGKKFGVLLMDYPGIPEELILAMVKTNYGDLYKKK